jgi:hypothetical protein
VAAARLPATFRDLAAAALSRQQPLLALSLVAAGKEGEAAALRGIALAMLQQFDGAQQALASAMRWFRRRGDDLGHARALTAAGEVALAQRDLRRARRWLEAALPVLQRLGDARNAAWTRVVLARLCVLRSDLGSAQRLLASAPTDSDAVLRGSLLLVAAEAALRRGDVAAAAQALATAAQQLADGAPLLQREVGGAAKALRTVVARLQCGGRAFELDLRQLQRLRAGTAPPGQRPGRWLVLDRIGQRVFWLGRRGHGAALGRRPVLFALLGALVAAWPASLSWRDVAVTVFDFDSDDASLLPRARVAVERLRAALPATATIVAARNAWRLDLPVGVRPAELDLVARPAAASTASPLLALLGDGAGWSASALAAAADSSVSSVQRALRELLATGDVVAIGRARARRYLAVAGRGIASPMLLAGWFAARQTGASPNQGTNR